LSGCPGLSTTHAYDPGGNRVQKTDISGTAIYEYDDLDRLRSLTAPGRGPVTYTISPAGRVTQIDHPDGTRTDQAYDAAGRLSQISHFNNGERQAQYAYAFDENGNRVSQIEDLGGGEVNTSYTYDDADRLVQTDRDGRVTDYVLDEVGNRTEETVTDALSSSSKAFSYNPRNQLQTIHLDGVLQSEYLYDANGNRVQATTAGITKEYTFSARDRLKSLATQGSPPSVEWAYDDAGFRISETTPTEARRFRWDGETLSYETNVLGNLLIRYDHGPDRLLAETETTQTRTWLIDGLRTPVKRLNGDGSTYSQTVYDEYGKVESELSPDIPRFGFTGHQRGPAEDPDLYYAQQRYYNAATGRFVSEDPLWGTPETPLSLHRYLYAYANPTVYVDPDGRMGMPNFWSEMPGYVAPETNELHYVDGSPERKLAAYEALTPAQRSEFAGARLGMLQNIGQLPVDMVFGMAAMVNAGVDLASGGRLYGGSARQVAEGFESTGRFLQNPIENTRGYFQNLEYQSQQLRDQGRHFEAGQVGAQGVFSIVEGGLAIAGTGSLGASAVRVGSETARDTISQLGKEVTGSPTAFYVQESTTGFILELWRGDVPLAKSGGVNVELRVMRGPQGGIRLRGIEGRIESFDQSVRRQLVEQTSDIIGVSTIVPDSLRRFDDIKRTRDTLDAQKTRSDAFEAVSESIDWIGIIGKILRDRHSDDGGS